MPAKSRSTGPFVAPITKLAYAPNAIFTDDEFLWQNQPQTTFATSIPLWALNTAVANTISTAGTGIALAQPIALQQGMVVTSISYRTTATAGTPTSQFVALYDNAATPNLLVTSGNLGSTSRANNTTHTVAMSRPYTIPASNIYYVSISFTGGTQPSLLGTIPTYTNTGHVAGVLGTVVLGWTHGSGLAGVAPATIASPTVVAKAAWVAVQ
jgi:hypothetical protein